jgi:type II secretory pathway pseudopilin PulG
MHKNGFTIIEVVVVFLLMLGVAFFILPKSLDNTKQARLISRWAENYSEVEYIFSVIKAQKDSEIREKLHEAKDNNVRKEIVLDVIKPYLRITSKVDSQYKQYYMNNLSVTPGGRYYFDTFYFASDNEIIGLKWVKEDCQGIDICAIMAFDVNGLDKPNIWGFDVFGINILKDNIEPIGKNIDPDVLKDDCAKGGFGVYCSYYYLIGGKFDN